MVFFSLIVVGGLENYALFPEAYKLWDRLSAERDHYLDGVEAELRGVGP
jgi:hypothetical protein